MTIDKNIAYLYKYIDNKCIGDKYKYTDNKYIDTKNKYYIKNTDSV